MNVQEAEKVYSRLEKEGGNILCIISTSNIQGEGVIVNAENYYNPNHFITFFIKMPGRKKAVEIPCFGVMEKKEGDK
ncbi:hypothetical protein ES705_24592 [subsurface metagenome]